MTTAREDTRPEVREERQSLWLLAVAPTIWFAHFMACYLAAAIWCAKVAAPAGPLGWTRPLMGVFTALALVGIGVSAWIGFRRHRLGHHSPPHRADTPADRHRFLGLAMLLVSGLSAVAVIYVGLVALFNRSCL